MSAAKPWQVLADAEAQAIADLGGITVDKVRGVEMLVLLKAGVVTVGRSKAHSEKRGSE